MFKLNGTSRKLVEFCTNLQHLNFNTKLEMILAIYTMYDTYIKPLGLTNVCIKIQSTYLEIHMDKMH